MALAALRSAHGTAVRLQAAPRRYGEGLDDAQLLNVRDAEMLAKSEAGWTNGDIGRLYGNKSEACVRKACHRARSMRRALRSLDLELANAG